MQRRDVRSLTRLEPVRLVAVRDLRLRLAARARFLLFRPLVFFSSTRLHAAARRTVLARRARGVPAERLAGRALS